MSNTRLLALLLAAALLAGWYYWQEQAPDPVAGAQAPASQPVTAADAPAATLQPVRNPQHDLSSATMNEIAARPLFNPSRAPRPAPEQVTETPAPEPDAQPPAAPEVNPADYELLAVAGADPDRVAVVRFAPQNRIYHLRKGQYLEQWQVEDVGSRTVKLAHEDKSFEIAMFKAPAADRTPVTSQAPSNGQASDPAQDQPDGGDTGDAAPAGMDGAGDTGEAPQQ